MNKLLFALMFLATAQSAFSADKAVHVDKKKTVKLNFENELIDSYAPNPELELVFQQKDFNYKRMIKLRKNFIPEAERALETLNGD